MRRLHFYLCVVLLVYLLLLPQFCASGSDGLKKNESAPLFIISQLDGSVSAINVRTGEHVWQFSSGGPLLESSVDEINPEGGAASAALDLATYILDDNSLRKEPLGVHELVDYTPFVSNDGTLFLGHKSSKLFAVDPVSGDIKYTNAATDNDPRMFRDTTSHCQPLIHLIRTDSTVEAHNDSSTRFLTIGQVNAFVRLCSDTVPQVETTPIPHLVFTASGQLMAFYHSDSPNDDETELGALLWTTQLGSSPTSNTFAFMSDSLVPVKIDMDHHHPQVFPGIQQDLTSSNPLTIYISQCGGATGANLPLITPPTTPSPSPTSRQIGSKMESPKLLTSIPYDPIYTEEDRSFFLHAFPYIINVCLTLVIIGLVIFIVVRNGQAAPSNNAHPFTPSPLYGNRPLLEEHTASTIFERNTSDCDNSVQFSLLSPPLTPLTSPLPSPSPSSRSPHPISTSTPSPASTLTASSALALTPSPISRYALDFEEREQLGQGGFGSVYRARKRMEGIDYAIKKVRIGIIDNESKARIMREVRHLAKLDHPNIIRYYNSWVEEDAPQDSTNKEAETTATGTLTNCNTTDTYNLTPEFTFSKKPEASENGFSFIVFEREESEGKSEDLTHSAQLESGDGGEESEEKGASEDEGEGEGEKEEKKERRKGTLYIQMQYCGRGTLAHWLARSDRIINPRENMRIFLQACEGVAHIHANGMIHRDLKPANILLSNDGTVKICDFGLSTDKGMEVTSLLEMSTLFGSHTTGVGSPLYCSPEQLKGQRYDEKVDIFSLGILLYEMFQVFSTQMERAQHLGMLRSGIVDNNTSARYPSLASLILLLVTHDPHDRPSARSILTHPLLRECELLK